MSSASLEELSQRIGLLEEANARLLEDVAARDSFIAVAAHELRNPMTPILGRISILRRMVTDPSMPLTKIADSLDQIEWLIDMFMKRATTLLDVSRLASDKPRLDLADVDAGRVAAQVVGNFAPLAKHSGSELLYRPPPEPVHVFADVLAVEQVLDNLVSNAIKYGGGTPVYVTLAADRARRSALIQVIDNGPGISPGARARIFERFERAVRPGEKTSGFGVGLWIVRQLCEAMSGSVDVHCPVSGGSMFEVILPLADGLGA